MGFSWDKLASYIPGVNTIDDAVHGRWKDAGLNLATGGLYGLGNGIATGVDAIRNAYSAPFDEKRAGYDAVAARAEQIKQERIARKDKTYAMAEEKYRPTREALAAVYGDPSQWKL